MSNRLIDILEDDTKMSQLHSNLEYKKSVLPRLEKLHNKMLGHLDTTKSDIDFIESVIELIKSEPSTRLRPFELIKCNKLWGMYKR